MPKFKSFVLAIAVIFLAGTQANAADAVDLRFGTVGVGSAWYNYGAGMADMVQPNLPEGSSIAVLPQAGGIGNLKLIQSDEMEIGITFAVSASEACSGTGVFEDDKQDKVRGVMGGLDIYYFGTFVTEDSGVTSWEGIAEGQNEFHLLTTRPGGTGEQAVQQVLALLRSSPEEVAENGGQIEATDRAGSAEALQDGMADGWAHTVTKGHPAATQIVTVNDTIVIGLPDEVIQGMVEKHGWSATTMPANTFEDQPEPVETVSTSSNIVAAESVPDDVVYTFVKTIMENAEKLPTIHAALGDFDPQNAADPALNGNCPMHPGAVRYYKEAGLMP